LAQQVQDSALVHEAHYWLGQVLYFSGEVVAACAHFEQAVALYDPRQRHAAIARGGTDFGVTDLAFLANVLWLLGYPDQARQRVHQGLTLDKEIDHARTPSAGWIANMLFLFLPEAQTVQQQAEALIAFCNERGLSATPIGTIRRGWALAMQGQEEDGIQQIHQ